MVNHMKTTLNIDDSIMQRLRQEAVRRGTTMSMLVESGIRRILDEPGHDENASSELKLPSWRSGGAVVDISNRSAVYELMEER